MMRFCRVVGTWVQWLLFGGEYPGDLIIGRFYSLTCSFPDCCSRLSGCMWL